jgi:hypothetical protein
MNRMLETRIARLEARAPDATADRPWVSILVDEGEDPDEAQVRYFAAHPEHAGCKQRHSEYRGLAQTALGDCTVNRTNETRLRKLESVKGATQRGGLIVAYDRAEADRKLAEARANGFKGEPLVILTGVPRADQRGWLLNEVATRGRKITDPMMRTAR